MPLQKLIFKPGVNRENTRYLNESGWYESDKIRFRQGTPEKIGGWIQYSASTFLGVCRNLWNWITTSNVNYVSLGTNLKFYITTGGAYYDITPVRLTLTLGANPFATNTATNSGGKTTITVTHTAHGATVNDFVSFSGATAVASVTVSGSYQILTVPTANTYTIQATGTATSSTSGGGSSVVATYQISTGPAIQTPYYGWGASTWGAGTWGNGGTVKADIRLWSAYNFGENLLYGPRGGGIYYWQVSNTTANPGVLLSSLGGNVTITIASPAVVTYTTALTDGTAIQFGTTGALPTGITAGTTYYINNLDGLTSQLLDANGNTVNTSGSQSGTQYISNLVDVPTIQNNILVSDASRFVFVFGTNNYGSSTIDPMLIRWSDQENPYAWTPDATNQAGSIRLSHGSQIVTVVQTRQEVFVITDQAVYGLQYIGTPYVWQTQILGDNISIIGPNAAALASGVIFWMGIDKFYRYDGRVQTQNCDLRKYIFNDINLYQNQQVFASTVEAFNEVWWFYCSADSSTINRYVVYNYLENTWYYGTMARTAWIDSGLQPSPLATTYNGYTVRHEQGNDDVETGTSAPIVAYVSSSEFDIGDGDHYSFIWRVLPDLTFSGTTSGYTGQTTMTLYPMQNSGSGASTPGVMGVTQGTDYNITEEFTGIVYTRVRGRQLIFKIGSSNLGTAWQLGAPRIDIRPDGRR